MRMESTNLSAASRDHVHDSDKKPLTRADREPAATGEPVDTRFMYFFTARSSGLPQLPLLLLMPPFRKVESPKSH